MLGVDGGTPLEQVPTPRMRSSRPRGGRSGRWWCSRGRAACRPPSSCWRRPPVAVAELHRSTSATPQQGVGGSGGSRRWAWCSTTRLRSRRSSRRPTQQRLEEGILGPGHLTVEALQRIAAGRRQRDDVSGGGPVRRPLGPRVPAARGRSGPRGDHQQKTGCTMPTVDVLDSTMFHEEAGVGTPLVFLHGNPISSYLWRHVLPRIGEPGRRLAPDLIGMGRSGSPTSVSLRRSRSYLDAWFDKFGLDAAVLVGHDWGGEPWPSTGRRGFRSGRVASPSWRRIVGRRGRRRRGAAREPGGRARALGACGAPSPRLRDPRARVNTLRGAR